MTPLDGFLTIADIHGKRITQALKHLKALRPFDADTIAAMTEQDVLYAELLVSRFAKLQDFMGHKLFDLLLQQEQEYDQNLSLLDKLHKLERLGIISHSTLWQDMRQMRNHATHEYPDHPELTATYLTMLIDYAPHLLQVLEAVKARLRPTL